MSVLVVVVAAVAVVAAVENFEEVLAYGVKTTSSEVRGRLYFHLQLDGCRRTEDRRCSNNPPPLSRPAAVAVAAAGLPIGQ